MLTMNLPVFEDIKDSPRLYIMFGGIAHALAMPPFEFFRTAQLLDHSKIFIRDFAQAWYQRGLPGIAVDAYGIRDYLARRVREIAPREVVFVGNSMGGFAALLFSGMIGGMAIAFAPQTFISPQLRTLHNDRRWRKEIAITHASNSGRDIYDVKPWSRNANMFVSMDQPLDIIHAEYLQDCPNVRIHRFPKGGHSTVVHCRDQGLLPSILDGTYGATRSTQ
jgi:pimeloyl-ACP methyl ester carboxylesterase